MDFPFADAPGIIRANQKDAYVEGDLHRKIRDMIQSLKGVRFTHNHTIEIQAFATLLYLGLTTLCGSRTLGEEYTDLFYVSKERKLPSKVRLALYVLTSGLAPMAVPKLTSKLKELVRRLTRNSGNENDDEYDESPNLLEEYLTPASLVSINLAVFYFTGAYYQISKRLFGLRYVFGYRVDPLTHNAGSYELIGFLMAVRGLFKLVHRIKSQIPQIQEQEQDNEESYVKDMGDSLEDPAILPFIQGSSRSCHLCYEQMRAPTVTLCGHMYCWSCISEWCRDQKVCPLCRQECHEQHLLNLRI